MDVVLKVHTDCSAKAVGGCVLIIIGLFSSRLYHAACFGNPVSDISGRWHSKASTQNSLVVLFMFSSVLEVNRALLSTVPRLFR